MMDIMGQLAAIQRPALLIRAARLGIESYQREPHLRRLLGCGRAARSGPALVALMELERDLDAQRRVHAAEYSSLRHVDVMIALMGEAQLIQAAAMDAGA